MVESGTGAHPAAVTVADARAWIADGQAQRALDAAQARSPLAPWRYVEADALRALGRHRDAADAYDAVAPELTRLNAAQAGYLAALLRLRRLDDPNGALRSLERGEVERSSLRERALIVRAQALERLGRRADLREVARAYLEEFPQGPREAWMRERAGTSGP